MIRFMVVFLKGERREIWPTRFDTLQAALACGHELTRDYVADFFKIVRSH